MKLIEQHVSLLAVPAVCLAEVVALMWLYGVLRCRCLPEWYLLLGPEIILEMLGYFI